MNPGVEVQESEYSTEENKKKFIWESFKIHKIKMIFTTNLEGGSGR